MASPPPPPPPPQARPALNRSLPSDVLVSSLPPRTSEEDVRRLFAEALSSRPFRGQRLSLRRFRTFKIFVGFVSEECTSQDLRVLFEDFGPVLECAIIRDYAFVHMVNEEDARAAIEHLNRTEVKGKTIAVEASRVHRIRQNFREEKEEESRWEKKPAPSYRDEPSASPRTEYQQQPSAGRSTTYKEQRSPSRGDTSYKSRFSDGNTSYKSRFSDGDTSYKSRFSDGDTSYKSRFSDGDTSYKSRFSDGDTSYKSRFSAPSHPQSARTSYGVKMASSYDPSYESRSSRASDPYLDSYEDDEPAYGAQSTSYDPSYGADAPAYRKAGNNVASYKPHRSDSLSARDRADSNCAREQPTKVPLASGYRSPSGHGGLNQTAPQSVSYLGEMQSETEARHLPYERVRLSPPRVVRSDYYREFSPAPKQYDSKPAAPRLQYDHVRLSPPRIGHEDLYQGDGASKRRSKADGSGFRQPYERVRLSPPRRHYGVKRSRDE